MRARAGGGTLFMALQQNYARKEAENKKYREILEHCAPLLTRLSVRTISEHDQEDAEVTADQIRHVLKEG